MAKETRNGENLEPHMPEPSPRQTEFDEALEREVDQAIAACDHDIRGALRAARPTREASFSPFAADLFLGNRLA